MKLSAVIITYNEAANIQRCIEAVKAVADDILVVDSFSKDDTVNIAKSFGARTLTHHFEGYGQQKNFAIENALYDWVICIDADEVLSENLQQEIIQLKSGNKIDDYAAYKFPLLNNYCGKWIKYGGWYPDPKPRLFNRTKGKWQHGNIHEYWAFNNSEYKYGLLKNNLHHYTITSLAQHLVKINTYSELSAEMANKKGKKCNLLQLYFGPKWFFFNRYILRLGFLDGYYGYVFCKMAAYEKWVKYAKIREKNKRKI